ncbi:hypothetical protein NECID01_2101 [Nematocida sp. AWRm77]|nr:hypothetical protein NECID01_2101 [Nematocida sp. AWRm77]
MEKGSLGETIRKVLLKHVENQRVSTWEYRSFSALWGTILSGPRMIGASAVCAVLCFGSLAVIFVRKRVFTQKDTLCVFIYMILTIFLLERVQQMVQVSLTVDHTYPDLEVVVPKSEIFWGGPDKQVWCESGLERELEKKKEEVSLGQKGSAAYRRLLRTRFMKKTPDPNLGTFVVDKATGQILGENSPGGKYTLKSAGTASLPQRNGAMEYCIFNSQPKECAQAGCMYLPPEEFKEAKAEMGYVDKVNTDYNSIQRKLLSDRKKYAKDSVALMDSFKEVSRTGMLMRDELAGVGVSLDRMENSILSLIHKYDSIFVPSVKAPRTVISMSTDSICVSIKDRAYPSRRLQASGAGTLSSGLSPDTQMERTERVVITQTRPRPRPDAEVRAGGTVRARDALDPLLDVPSFSLHGTGACLHGACKPRNSFMSFLYSALVPKSFMRSSVRDWNGGVEMADPGLGREWDGGVSGGVGSGRGLSFAGESLSASPSESASSTNRKAPSVLNPYPIMHRRKYLDDYAVTSPVRPEDNGFFWGLSSILAWSEVLMFVQVFLVLCVILFLVFEKKFLYMLLYFVICASLVLSLVVGAYSFTYAAGLSSICKQGLGCHNRIAVQAQSLPKKVSDIIDIPQKVLKESVSQSEQQLQRQIDTLLTTNTAEDLEDLTAQLTRLFQMKGDFQVLIAGNSYRNIIVPGDFYASASKMQTSLNNIKALDAKMRSSAWSDTFRELVQVNVLISDGTKAGNVKRRTALLSKAGEVPQADPNTCSGKEEQVCTLQTSFDSLFSGLVLFSVILPVLIAI